MIETSDYTLVTGIRCVVRNEPYHYDRHHIMLETSDYNLMTGIRCVVRYEPYLITGMTYVRNFRLYPNDWNKMCGPL